MKFLRDPWFWADLAVGTAALWVGHAAVELDAWWASFAVAFVYWTLLDVYVALHKRRRS